MRVTSALFVSALMRRAMVGGAFAAVTKRGASEAGAIFVVVDRLDGTLDLYGQAPQSAFLNSEKPTDRLFTRIEEGVARERILTRLGSEERFDPDLYVVEIEDKEARPFLQVVEG